MACASALTAAGIRRVRLRFMGSFFAKAVSDETDRQDPGLSDYLYH